MNNFKTVFLTLTGVLMLSACGHRGANPYAVQTQNNSVSVDIPVNRIVIADNSESDVVGELISNADVETIITRAK